MDIFKNAEKRVKRKDVLKRLTTERKIKKRPSGAK